MRAGSSAVATSNGLFAYRAGTGVASTLTIRTRDGQSSGWAGDEGADWNTIESRTDRGRRAAQVPRLARQDRARSRQVRGRARADGRRHAALAPARGLRRAAGGRGPFVLRQARRRQPSRRDSCSTRASRSSATRPRRTRRPTRSRAAGCPSRREVWVENGVLKTLSYSRFWAMKHGVPPRAGAVERDHVGRRRDARGHDRVGQARRADHPFLVHPPAQSAHRRLHRPHARRHVSHRERQDQPAGHELPIQPVADGPARQRGHGGSRDAGRGRAKAASPGVPVVVPALKVRDFTLSSVSDAI